MAGRFSKAAQAALNAVTGKRARIVVDHIIKHGSITTDDLKEKYGYDHPPRAIKDVSDQGIPLVKVIVRKADGKRMAEYRFGDLDNITAGRVGGRANFPKAFKESLVAAYGSKCALCNALFEPRYLQIDHRIPYLVAGDGVADTLDVKDYMLVCGSCNRAKSWSCEHCPNGIEVKDPGVCAACYWANPLQYTHVATADIRRLDLTWTGPEVSDFDDAKAKAGTGDGAMPKFVKDAVRRAVCGNGRTDP
ncbi:MAG: HNH endonuclease [Phycisphaerales bacterium]|nr:MAG: HNH endonuclease [Phycisphaerales bacterium]